jgi:PTS system galactitol-specific IIC component
MFLPLYYPDMQTVSAFISWFFDFKAFVMLPVIFLLIAAVARMSIGAAISNSLKLGAGFAGIFMIFDAFLGMLRPAIASMVASRGLNFPVVDAGWPPLAAITWSSWIAPVVILLVIVINIAMLFLRTTTVLYIDIWNYWHFALIGSMLLAVGAHPAVALAGAAFSAIVVIKTTEWTAPYVKKETGIEGVAVSPLTVSGFLPWAVLVDRALETIPGVRSIRWDPSRGDSRWSKAGDPMLVGFALGSLLGVLAGYSFKDTAELAVKIAAVMFVLPRCGGLIGEGTGAISLAIQKRLSPLFGGRRILISMDTGFLMTNASVVVTGLALMPISLLIAFILPGNKVLPAGDLPNLMSIMSVIVIACGGNVFRAVLAAVPVIATFLVVATKLAPLITELAAKAGALESAGAETVVSSFTDGGNPLRWWIFELFRGNLVALALLVPIGLLWVYAARRSRGVAKEGN